MNTLLTLMAALALLVLTARLDVLHRPLWLVALGVLAGQGVVWSDWDTGIDAAFLSQLILWGLLPPLVLDLAQRVSLRRLRRIRWWVLAQSLATFAMVSAGTAWALHRLIDHPGFPWQSAWVAGILVATVDPGWGRALLGRYRQTEAWLEGEALVVDTLALTLLALLWQPGLELNLASPEASGLLVKTLGLSLVVGYLGSLAGWVLARWGLLSPGAALVWAWWVFWCAEGPLDGSGVVALFAGVLWLGRTMDLKVPPLAPMLGDALALILGFSLTLEMFTERYLAMGMAVLLAWGLRWLGGQLWIHWPSMPMVRRHRALMWQAPVHGPVSLALILALPVHLDAWWTVQAIGYGVILADLLWLPWLSRRWSG